MTAGAFVPGAPLTAARKRVGRRLCGRRRAGASLSAAPADMPTPSETPSTPDWRAFRAQLAVQHRLNRAPTHHSSAQMVHWAQRQHHVERGVVLVAAPDYRWQPAFRHLSHAVILVTDVCATGVCGLLLNRPTNYTVRHHRSVLARVGPHFGDNVVHLGGDCSTGSLEVLHSLPPSVCAGAAEVVPGVFRGGFNSSRQLVKSGSQQASTFRFFVAYSQWTWDTLRAEMGRGAWITVSCSPSLLLQKDTHSLWCTIMRMIS